MLKSINRAYSPEKSCGSPKPRPMAWAGITAHLRCSRLTECRIKDQSCRSPGVLKQTCDCRLGSAPFGEKTATFLCIGSGSPKPRPMAWAGITAHLRCSRLTECRIKGSIMPIPGSSEADMRLPFGIRTFWGKTATFLCIGSGSPKPRPMAWAGITAHLRCSRLTECRIKGSIMPIPGSSEADMRPPFGIRTFCGKNSYLSMHR